MRHLVSRLPEVKIRRKSIRFLLFRGRSRGRFCFTVRRATETHVAALAIGLIVDPLSSGKERLLSG
jgi:hypothetical protein